MPSIPSREVRLAKRPVGTPHADDFDVGQNDAAEPGPGMVQVRNLWMSVDPYMRGRMYDRPSYVPPFQIGEALQGHAMGQVVASGDPGFAPGDIVSHMFGWREALTAPAVVFTKVDTQGAPIEAFLGILGMPGMTAYCGFLAIGKPKVGEVVFVSGAAGAVGSAVCQIAKIKGCTVIGTAGSDEKCDWLRSVGVDHAINYKTCGDLLTAVRAAAPKGIDIYFDNVGGEHLEVALELAKPFARFAECGMISQYNDTEARPGPSNLIYVVGKSLTIQGFIVSNYASMQGEFVTDMANWIRDGKIKYEETIEHGIENAATAFVKLFSGGNTGKMLVKLS